MNGSSDTTGDAVSRFVLRWAWRLDAAANRVTVWTGRLATRAIFSDMRRRGER